MVGPAVIVAVAIDVLRFAIALSAILLTTNNNFGSTDVSIIFRIFHTSKI